MRADKLTELQEKLESNQPLDADQCAALVAEVWRLKTVIAGKTIELRALQDEARALQLALDDARTDQAAIQREIDELKEIHGLPACELEQRWTNCAVRLRKRAAETARRAEAKS